MSDDPRPRLLLVEDDPRLGPLVAESIADGFEVTLRARGAGIADELARGGYEVAVIDRRLPDLDGLAIVRALRHRRIPTPVLVLTARGTLDDKVEGLDAGANDYLVKPFEIDELSARLRALTRPWNPGPDGIDIGGWVLYPDAQSVHSPYDGRIRLTARESALLHVLAAAPERVHSRAELLSRVFAAGDTPGTVDTYVHYLRKKTEPDIVETVRGAGYRIGFVP